MKSPSPTRNVAWTAVAWAAGVTPSLVSESTPLKQKAAVAAKAAQGGGLAKAGDFKAGAAFVINNGAIEDEVPNGRNSTSFDSSLDSDIVPYGSPAMAQAADEHEEVRAVVGRVSFRKVQDVGTCTPLRKKVIPRYFYLRGERKHMQHMN